MYNPIATYRLQFNKDFTFSDFESLLPYFQRLGITTVYASPIFVASPESSHGYDGVDPTRINPEIGTLEQLRAISQRLKAHGMGWIQDIVPNHMAYHPNNERLMDMLEKGTRSRYANFFETSLSSTFFHGRIQAPFLPESLDETIAQGKLTLAYEESRFVWKVSGDVLPLKPESYSIVLQSTSQQPNDAIRQLLVEIDQLRHQGDPTAFTPAWEELLLQLASLMETPQTSAYVANCLKTINENPDLLRQLADEQHYHLCPEPETRQRMNYRRFFTVNGLICLNMREETVFQEFHSLIKTLLDEGVFQGVRIDHVDGLFDPAQYLGWLRQVVGDERYVVVEKILQANEKLPTNWPVQGTSGYDFLAMVNNLLTDGRSETHFRTYYHELLGSDTSLPDRIRDRKAYFLAQYMGGELDNLYHYFLSQNLVEGDNLPELTKGELKLAIGELLVACPVYRYYGNAFPLPDEEATMLRSLLKTIRQHRPELTTAVNILDEALLLKPPVADSDYRNRAVRFYQRLMQFCSPLMAKGVEDTLLYTYNCFIGHNEVGDSPEQFGMSVDAFHQAMHYQQQHWPYTLNTTATHDTKRGEDARARLNVLTSLPNEWLAEVKQWMQLVEPLRSNDAPDANDTYFIFQNLLATYPMPQQDEDDFPERFHLYLEKALQEAKRHTTGWVVDDTYHTGILNFTNSILNKQGDFWRRFQPFHAQIANFGVVNSLAQVMLKFTCPGVPDVYQGGEGWDLSLVDPDNRRPVDFMMRQQWLSELSSNQSAPATSSKAICDRLWEGRFDGRIKLWLTHILLQERQQNAALFLNGNYVPLAVKGTYREHIMAFARQLNQAWYVVVVPLYPAQLCRQQNTDLLSIDWADTSVILPADAPTNWHSRLDGSSGKGNYQLSVQSLLRSLPVALLTLD
ncbi:malto-oligosyltrehalose synthase [Spirosoma daeguense]